MKCKRWLSVVMLVCFMLNFVCITSYAENMKISTSGIKLIEEFESYQKYQYWDVSQWSIGYGSATYDGEYPNGISQSDAEKLLINLVNTKYGVYVNDFLNKYGITVNQNQFDALTSFTYNVGNVWGSTFSLKTMLINGVENYSDDDIRTGFGNWNKSGGKVLQGLVTRRAKEADLFLSGGTVDPIDYEYDDAFPTPIVCYPKITSGKVALYDSNRNQYSLSKKYIAYNDQCTILEVYIDGYCKVKYPTSSGYSTAYALLSDFMGCLADPYYEYPKTNKDVYIRDDMTEKFGTVWTTDKYMVLEGSSKNINITHILYPLDGGGYKAGWIYNTDEPGPSPEPPTPIVVPGPVASGAFNGKTIIAMALNEVDLGYEGSIHRRIYCNDICIISNVNPNTGYCTVEYPIGGATDATKDGVETRTVSNINMNTFINYNGSAQAETAKIPYQLTAYPTYSMEHNVGNNQTNWWLDPDDTYVTINKIDEKTEVLYYCSQGRHTGKWKLGWVYLDYFSLDLNGLIDGNEKGDIEGCGYANVIINGKERLKYGTDFYSANGVYPVGSTYEINGIQAVNSYEYNGVSSGTLTGVLDSNKSVRLSFTKGKASCVGIKLSSKPEKTIYLEGEKFDATGLSVVANYNDSTNKDVTNQCSLSGYTGNPGVNTIHINYAGYDTTFTVTVNQKIPSELQISHLPKKTTYRIGEELRFEGLELTAIYNNGTSALVTDYDVFANSEITSKSGEYDIYVGYTYNDIRVETNFSINVSESVSGYKAGDINGDGSVNNKDITRFFQYLSDWDVSVIQSTLDTNGDGSVNNKDLTRLFQYLSDWDVEIFGGGSDDDEITTDSFVYGQSVNGRDLVCYSFTPKDYEKTILLEYEIHGFEDEYAHDGQVLVNTANTLIDHYSKVTDLNKTRLLIIPSANPDGLLDGTTNQGFGRCNADGIDLNRDFDANYVSVSTARNYTPYAFSGKESRALRDLCLEYEPDIVIDFHGWESSLIGDSQICDPFHEELGLNRTHGFYDTNARGYFTNWAHQQGALAMIVEFTSSTSVDTQKVINAVDRLINNEYDDGKITGDYSIFKDKNSIFMSPSNITLSNGSIKANDLCYISDINVGNGTCTVVYPTNGGTSFLTSGQATSTAQISLENIIGENNSYTVIKKFAGNNDVRVYPTSALVANSTNWYIEEGQVYYTLNETSNATAVLYYCCSGGHAGYWKIGWISK